LLILNQGEVITAEMVNMQMDDKQIVETNSPNKIPSLVTVNQFCAFKEMELLFFKNLSSIGILFSVWICSLYMRL